jgi:hypothetical protein
MEQTMKATTQLAADVGHGDRLEQVKDRFTQWRQGRKPGERISNALWALAVGLVEQHGVQRIAQELCVDCRVLKKHIVRNVGPAPAVPAAPQFVELFAQPALSTAPTFQCVVEMQNVKGRKMRVELGSIDGLVGLASAFWSAR